MPLFFWILIGVAGVMLAALIVILLAELGSQHRKRSSGRGAVSAPKARDRATPKAASAPKKPLKRVQASVAESTVSAEPETIPPVTEALIVSGPAAPAVEIPGPEAAEMPEVAETAVEVPSAAPAEFPAGAVPTPYPAFSNARAVEQLGLTQDEADMFIGELVVQIGEELPQLEDAAAAHDAEKLEAVTHMLKGSATNLGTGGVSDVLVAFNTYCKSGSDPQVIQRHMDDLHFYFGELKAQFGA